MISSALRAIPNTPYPTLTPPTNAKLTPRIKTHRIRLSSIDLKHLSKDESNQPN